jgi:hypothetical protein
LLAGIRALAECPCPRCYIKKLTINLLGTVGDMFRRNWLRVDTPMLHQIIANARRCVFVLGRALGSAAVNTLLQAQSWVPVQVRIALHPTARSILTRSQNAFSSTIFPLDPTFNSFRMFAPDLMHEFELGVWKAVFVHLVRLLEAIDKTGGLLEELNRR